MANAQAHTIASAAEEPQTALNLLMERPDHAYASEAEIAAATGKLIGTLRCDAARRIGPPRCKLGKQIFYRIGSFRTWLKAHERDFEALTSRRRRRTA